jgi:hypothetical protein
MARVKIIRGKKTIAAAIGVKILGGDRIETAKNTRMTFGYENEDTAITIGDKRHASRTEVTVGDGGKGKRLSLHEGLLKAKVAPQPEGRPMEVTTPHARARVVGTSFTLYPSSASLRESPTAWRRRRWTPSTTSTGTTGSPPWRPSCRERYS